MSRRVLVLDPASRTALPRSTDTLSLEPRRGQIVWIDFESPTRQELDEVGERYDLHPLALEDCLHDDQRPKLESYENYIFMVLHHAEYDAKKNVVVLSELDMFLGPTFVITSHLKPMPWLDTVRERWNEASSETREGASYLMYLIADTLVDDYFPLIDCIEERVADLDEQVFEHFSERLVPEIFQLKKQLLFLRRIIGPTRDAFVLMLRREQPLVGRNTTLHLQDVYDHLIRIADTLDLYRDLASGVQDVYLSMIAQRTNDTMKKLTAISAILMTVTLIAGIYGMNFEFMPELKWRYGYFYALGAMVLVTLLLLGIARGKKYI